jgi:glycosyltransferase involved in cell wall biosynthesis
MANIEIALATFQSEKYLRAQLSSLFSQSDQNFSVLVADDGSTDSTLQILAEYATKYPRRMHIMQFGERAGGPCQNFSRILDAAQSNYLMFCDHDDIWLDDKIETSLNRMRESEAALGSEFPILVHTDLSVVGSDLRSLYSSLSRHEKLQSHKSDFRRLLAQNNATGCTMMLNRALYQIVRPIPREAPMHDWWIALVAAAFGKITFVPRPTILYRQHERNSVGITKRRSSIDQFLRVVNFVRGRNSGGRMRLLRVTNQARLFRDRYAASLSARQYTLLSHLADLWSRPTAARLWIIITNRFFAFRTMRTIELLIGACARRSGVRD